MELEVLVLDSFLTMRAEYILAFAALAAPLLAAKPVQVYILMGQSNMLGEGRKADLPGLVANGTGKYPYLWDSAEAGGGWATSKNVRSVFVKGSGGAAAPATLFNNELMTAAPTIPAAVPGTTPREKDSIGPELGIGFALGNHTPGSDDPIMVLKSCTGGRSLGWDLLPPTQAGFDYTDPASNVTYTYAGYHQSPNRWAKGTTPRPIGWEAGLQYDGDVARAAAVLANLTSHYYPGAAGYEVAGFFWWQGTKDTGDMALAERYEQNLVALIKALRLLFDAPAAKFVTATLGQTLQSAANTTAEGAVPRSTPSMSANLRLSSS